MKSFDSLEKCDLKPDDLTQPTDVFSLVYMKSLNNKRVFFFKVFQKTMIYVKANKGVILFNFKS